MKKKSHRQTKASGEKSTTTLRPSQRPAHSTEQRGPRVTPAPQNTTSCFVEHTEDWRPCWLSSGVLLSPDRRVRTLTPPQKIANTVRNSHPPKSMHRPYSTVTWQSLQSPTDERNAFHWRLTLASSSPNLRTPRWNRSWSNGAPTLGHS